VPCIWNDDPQSGLGLIAKSPERVRVGANRP